jgi:prepilin peptidase CpaA
VTAASSLGPYLAALALATVLVAACVQDLRRRRIPNRLILVGLAAAVVWQALGAEGRWAFDADRPGAVGLVGGGAALLAMLVGFFPLYALRIMGAGDVKLLAVVAAFFGASADAWLQLPALALCVLVAGGVLSVARMAIAGTGAAVLGNVRLVMTGYFARLSGVPGPSFDARTDSVDRMPYAFAILAGTFFYVAGTWSGWLTVL